MSFKKGDILRIKSKFSSYKWYHEDWLLRFVKVKKSGSLKIARVYNITKGYYDDYSYDYLEKSPKQIRNEKIDNILKTSK